MAYGKLGVLIGREYVAYSTMPSTVAVVVVKYFCLKVL